MDVKRDIRKDSEPVFQRAADAVMRLKRRQMKVLFLLTLFEYMSREELYAWLATPAHDLRHRRIIISYIWRMMHPPAPIIIFKHIAVKRRVKKLLILNPDNHLALAVGKALVEQHPALAERVRDKRWRILQYLTTVKKKDVERLPGDKPNVKTRRKALAQPGVRKRRRARRHKYPPID